MIVFAHDYETTGVQAKTCGVVQAALCFAKLYEDGSYEILSKDVQLLNPGMEIPAGASNVHGIFDHHVEGSPEFGPYLAEQLAVVNDTDVEAAFGYNNRSYDDVIARRFGLKELPCFDIYVATRRFKTIGKLKSAKLSDAYATLTEREPENAHDAFADIVMSLDLIKPSMAMTGFQTLPEFHQWLSNPWATPSMEMPFGRHKGVKLCNLPKSYVKWARENLEMDSDLKASMELLS